MYNIAILGSENSHARAFCEIMNVGSPLLGGIPYPDFHVIGVCGDNKEENELLCSEYGVDEMSDDGNAWLDRADAIMVTARHGGKHLKYAEEYIKRGIPAFIDKPVTVTEEDALSLMRLAKRNNVPLTGGSMCGAVSDTQRLKALVAGGLIDRTVNERLGRIFGGCVTAAVNMKNEWGDFFFYSQHLVQIMMEIFGYDVESVYALSRDDAATFVARYKDYDVSGHYGTYSYSASIFADDRVIYQTINVADGYLREFEQFANMVRSGRMATSYEDLIKPVFVLNAIYKSMNTGLLTDVNKVVL